MKNLQFSGYLIKINFSTKSEKISTIYGLLLNIVIYSSKNKYISGNKKEIVPFLETKAFFKKIDGQSCRQNRSPIGKSA